MSIKPKLRREAVARKKLISQIISITMYISTVVPNIMLLTATPARNMEGQASISSRSTTTIVQSTIDST